MVVPLDCENKHCCEHILGNVFDQAEIVSPFVRMTVKKRDDGKCAGSSEITVGNNSNPNRKNKSAIKSFTYGQSDGAGAQVEIFDEEGGDFHRFICSLPKNSEAWSGFLRVQIQWGWLASVCENDPSNEQSVMTSRKHFFSITSIEVNLSGGKFLYKLEMLCSLEALFQTRSTNVFEHMTIENAANKLLKCSHPEHQIKYTEIVRTASGCKGQSTERLFRGFEEAPRNIRDSRTSFKLKTQEDVANWRADGKNAFEAMAGWFSWQKTDKDKGIIMFYDDLEEEPTIILMPDPKQLTPEEKTFCNSSFGTFIVNGSSNSSVISFEPTIKFNYERCPNVSIQSGATAISQTSSDFRYVSPDDCFNLKKKKPNNFIEDAKERTEQTEEEIRTRTAREVAEIKKRLEDMTKKNPCANNNTPGPTAISVQPTQAEKNGTDPKEVADAIKANAITNLLYHPFEADLKIIGDPRLDDPIELKIFTVSVIVINPFTLQGNGGQDSDECPEWLNGPPCNDILSNKNYNIMGVSHEIREGSYTTTLKLALIDPSSQSAGEIS